MSGSSALANNLAPSDDGASPPSTNGHAAAAQRQLKHSNHNHLLWLMVPFVYAMVGWSLGAGYLVSERVQQIVEVVGISLIGALGVFLAAYARSRNSKVERAYSTHLEELSQRLRSLAYRDSLTDLYNHRYFYEQLSHEVERANRYGRPVSVILLDLNNFKAVNDTYGHLMGDQLLSLIGRIINSQVRGADIAARYGGDEFAVILPDTPRAAAEATAIKLTTAIASSHTTASPLGGSLTLSASWGVACCPDEARTVSELLQLADDRGYADKRADAAATTNARAGELVSAGSSRPR